MLTINVDGASRGNPGRAACALVALRDGAVVLSTAKVIGDQETNNVAEYRALLGALRHLSRLRLPDESVDIRSDSMLVVEQVNGRWNCNQPHLSSLCVEARERLRSFAGAVTLSHVPRGQNRAADALCNQALDKQRETHGATE